VDRRTFLAGGVSLLVAPMPVGAQPATKPPRLVLNMRTAKALGLTIPPVVLARADEVIQ
jgi:hypothetical protein